MDRIKKETEKEMKASIESFKHLLGGIRVGRASSGMLDRLKIEYFGAEMKINQLATVSTPDARTLMITVFDPVSVSAIEKAILQSNLGLQPQTDKNTIRLNIPPMTEEKRKEVAKEIKEMSENAKVAVRSKRQDANNKIKNAKKDGDITEDDVKRLEKDVQKLTDDSIKEIERICSEKEAEVMKV